MRTPREILYTRLDRAMDIPDERPDLLLAAARSRYKKAAAFGAFAVANYAVTGLHYGPVSLYNELEVANWIGQIGGMAGAMYHGMIGVTQRFIVDYRSFPALDNQLQQDEFSETHHPESPDIGIED